MGVGYSISCNKCDYTRSLDIGVGMLHSSLEAEIQSMSKKEQLTINKTIEGKENLLSESEGYSVFQCYNCCSIYNKFHIKIIHDDKVLYENKPQCFKCKREMKLLFCDQDHNTITNIKCVKCKSDDIQIDLNMMWD